MLNSMATSKVQADHLDRQALIYVRQSTLTQVLENTGSQARQYDLTQRAYELTRRSGVQPGSLAAGPFLQRLVPAA